MQASKLEVIDRVGGHVLAWFMSIGLIAGGIGYGARELWRDGHCPAVMPHDKEFMARAQQQVDLFLPPHSEARQSFEDYLTLRSEAYECGDE